MSETTVPEIKFSLEGAWSIGEVADRHELLLGELRRLPGIPTPARAVVDLAQITGIDASGCQLLAVFLGNLRRTGLEPEACGASPELWQQIVQLGFAEDFDPSRSTGEETV